MDVGIGKSGYGDSLDSDYACTLFGERLDFGPLANRHDAAARDRHCRGLGMRTIQGEKLPEENSVRSSDLRRDGNRCRLDQQHKEKSNESSHNQVGQLRRYIAAQIP